MTIGACLLFLACAFYFGYFAESSLLGQKGKMVVWSISIALAAIPIFALLIEAIRGIIHDTNFIFSL